MSKEVGGASAVAAVSGHGCPSEYPIACQSFHPKLSTSRGALQKVCSFRLPLTTEPSV